jgi:ribosomal protein S18 acetylase RimI-like enzyme
VATTLNRAAFAWAGANGVREIVLNTTSAQEPALNLYRKLGMRELFHSFVGEYELVWMALDL